MVRREFIFRNTKYHNLTKAFKLCVFEKVLEQHCHFSSPLISLSILWFDSTSLSSENLLSSNINSAIFLFVRKSIFLSMIFLKTNTFKHLIQSFIMICQTNRKLSRTVLMSECFLSPYLLMSVRLWNFKKQAFCPRINMFKGNFDTNYFEPLMIFSSWSTKSLLSWFSMWNIWNTVWITWNF